MNKVKILILLSLTVLVTGGVVRLSGSTGPAYVQWEYGVYRVGYSKQKYEWQTEDYYAYGKTQQELLNKIKVKIRKRTKAEHGFDALFLNGLGTQGWELIDTTDRGTGPVVNRIFWLKRERSMQR